MLRTISWVNESQLKENERLTAMGRTAAMVGHDLRNPLQAVAGYTSIIEEYCSTCPSKKGRCKDSVRAISDQILYMDNIVSDLQDYARPLKPELRKTKLSDLVNQVILAIQIPQTIETFTEIPKDFRIQVDPFLMRRVFTNMFRNAAQDMTDGGKLTVAAATIDGQVQISITDTGVGISEENMAKLFTPLFTTKSKGQGFGLAVCKRIIEAHGGTITAKSEEDKGAEFTIRLPLNKIEG